MWRRTAFPGVSFSKKLHKSPDDNKSQSESQAKLKEPLSQDELNKCLEKVMPNRPVTFHMDKPTGRYYVEPKETELE